MGDMASPIEVRWSSMEAAKPYARPFGVFFRHGTGPDEGVAVNGTELLYFRYFQAAVLNLTGEIFRDPGVAAAEDPQAAWLDVLGRVLPAFEFGEIRTESTFDDERGRTFRFACGGEGVSLTSEQLLSYQDFQAIVAHRTGRLYRNRHIEGMSDEHARYAGWVAVLADLLTGTRGAGDAGG